MDFDDKANILVLNDHFYVLVGPKLFLIATDRDHENRGFRVEETLSPLGWKLPLSK